MIQRDILIEMHCQEVGLEGKLACKNLSRSGISASGALGRVFHTAYISMLLIYVKFEARLWILQQYWLLAGILITMQVKIAQIHLTSQYIHVVYMRQKSLGECLIDVWQEEAKSGQSFQKAKVIETNDSDGKKQKKAVTEDGEVIYLGFSKEYALKTPQPSAVPNLFLKS